MKDHVKRSEPTCKDDYVGETTLWEPIKHHTGRDCC